MIEQVKKFLGWVVLPATILLAVIWRLLGSLSAAKSELARKKAEEQIAATFGKMDVAHAETKNAEDAFAAALARAEQTRKSAMRGGEGSPE